MPRDEKYASFELRPDFRVYYAKELGQPRLTDREQAALYLLRWPALWLKKAKRKMDKIKQDEKLPYEDLIMGVLRPLLTGKGVHVASSSHVVTARRVSTCSRGSLPRRSTTIRG